MLKRAKKPFIFNTRLHLQELTGFSASNLKELLEHVKTVSGSVIYQHTHRFLQIHLYMSPEPPNDFSYWVTGVLGEKRLGERLASIETCEFSTIRKLRKRIIKIIENHLKKSKEPLRRAHKGEEFQFIKTVSFVFPTPYVAHNLREFIDILKKVSISSIYFHIFEARLRLEKYTNDFSHWIDTSLKDAELAQKISRLDPYNFTLERLRAILIEMLEEKLKDEDF